MIDVNVSVMQKKPIALSVVKEDMIVSIELLHIVLQLEWDIEIRWIILRAEFNSIYR